MCRLDGDTLCRGFGGRAAMSSSSRRRSWWRRPPPTWRGSVRRCGAASAAAVAPTSSVIAAGADEVSASIAALFGAHAQVTSVGRTRRRTGRAKPAAPPLPGGLRRPRCAVRVHGPLARFARVIPIGTASTPSASFSTTTPGACWAPDDEWPDVWGPKSLCANKLLTSATLSPRFVTRSTHDRIHAQHRRLHLGDGK